jgi:hypothetical protein
MDPDEALSQLRKLVAVTIDGGTPDGKPTPREAMEEFAELFSGLDNWMSTGGFLPKPWRRS